MQADCLFHFFEAGVMVIHAVYENGVFRPLGTVELPEGRQVIIQTGPLDSTPDSSEAAEVDRSALEVRLLEEINLGLTGAEWSRFRELIAKRQQESLNAVELAELTSTSDRVEAMNARRMECLVELAKLRNVALPVLLEQLGIVPPQVI